MPTIYQVLLVLLGICSLSTILLLILNCCFCCSRCSRTKVDPEDEKELNDEPDHLNVSIKTTPRKEPFKGGFDDDEDDYDGIEEVDEIDLDHFISFNEFKQTFFNKFTVDLPDNSPDQINTKKIYEFIDNYLIKLTSKNENKQ